LENQSERYGHIWEGEYATVLEGAYYAKHLTDAQLERRIGFIPRDPLMKVYACWDIGGTSSKSDATSIWIVQFIGPEVRVLDYYYAVTPMSYLREAGFVVDLVKNQGAGAALQRIDATRRLFPAIRFNEETTRGGREALGWYHEKRDEVRGIGLGPEHDFSSHAADAFGLVAIYKAGMATQDDWGAPLRRNLKGIA
jgi:phage terminase large subunit